MIVHSKTQEVLSVAPILNQHWLHALTELHGFKNRVLPSCLQNTDLLKPLLPWFLRPTWFLTRLRLINSLARPLSQSKCSPRASILSVTAWMQMTGKKQSPSFKALCCRVIKDRFNLSPDSCKASRFHQTNNEKNRNEKAFWERSMCRRRRKASTTTRT